MEFVTRERIGAFAIPKLKGKWASGQYLVPMRRWLVGVLNVVEVGAVPIILMICVGGRLPEAGTLNDIVRFLRKHFRGIGRPDDFQRAIANAQDVRHSG